MDKALPGCLFQQQRRILSATAKGIEQIVHRSIVVRQMKLFNGFTEGFILAKQGNEDEVECEVVDNRSLALPIAFQRLAEFMGDGMMGIGLDETTLDVSAGKFSL